jgi:methylmalonyl-CoA/ethylmalonyl-CoA epimerase
MTTTTTPRFRFHHVGLAAHALGDSAAALAALGIGEDATLAGEIEDPGLGVRLRFCRGDETGAPRLELVAGLADENPVKRILARMGPTPYHLCFAVDALDTARAHLEAHDFAAVGPPQPARAFGGRLVQFFRHRDLGLIELLEQPEDL